MHNPRAASCTAKYSLALLAFSGMALGQGLPISSSLRAPASTPFAPAPVFRLVADQTTTPPGGSGTFNVFHDARAIDGGQVVFIGSDNASGSGVYSYQNGVLSVIANKNTVIPSVGVTFSIFFDVTVDGGQVSMTGGWPGPSSGCSFFGSEGLLTANFDGSGLSLVADTVNHAPNCFHGVDSDQDVLAVCAGVNPVDSLHNHSESILLSGSGGLNLLVNTSTTPPPNQPAFLGFDQEVVLDAGGYLFADILPNTFGAVGKLYSDRNDGFGLQLVVDNTTLVPGGSGTFTNLAGFDFDGGEALFMGRSVGANGIYAGVTPTGLRVIANSSTQVPGESVNFLGFSNPVAYKGGVIAFSGYWSGGGNGLFVMHNGQMRSVLKKGDTLGGALVEQAFCRTQDISNGQLLIDVRFANFANRALYLVTL